MSLYNRGKTKLKIHLNSQFPYFMTKYYYKKLLKRSLNINNPIFFNEKVNWLKFNYLPNNELAIKCADKYLVRDYLLQKGMGEYLNNLIDVWDNVNEINWDQLPNKFAIKCNHGAGMNIICTDKSNLSEKKVLEQLAEWMEIDYGKTHIQPHYSKIERKIICESFIDNLEDTNKLPIDYKIHCFHGIPKLITCYSDRENRMTANFYDSNWNIMDIATKPSDYIEKPLFIDEMLNIAKVLSEDFPYVRVDFYEQNNNVIFGELTFTPANGMSDYMTEEGDLLMGEYLDLSSYMN